ncbi:4-hydroxybenzoate octaprenyltransferase [Paracoccus pacificus]|uniref:4-hydroxybenzoate octaprenyltransferase n=1 Tax=Paracoccus pacificus TaxID=1463598 RepID=A0ABW4R992_9RHOB
MQPARPVAPAQVADAPADNLVDLYAPEAWKPWLRLSRADRPIGTWLLLLPCWWGLALAMMATGRAGLFDLWIALACGIGALVMRGAGCTWNDITDRDFDARVARTRSRPIPSGQVSVRGAFLWLGAQLVTGAVILLTLGWSAIIWGVASLGLVAIYPFAKRFTWWPQVFLGFAFNWGIFVAWAAHGAPFGAAPLLLWLSGIAWTLFYDTIYAHQDIQDDALIGVKSTARLFAEKTPGWLAVFGGLSVLLMLAAILVVPAGGALARLLSLAAPVGFSLHLFRQWRRFEIGNDAGLITLFRSNRDAGVIVTLFLTLAALA